MFTTISIQFSHKQHFCKWSHTQHMIVIPKATLALFPISALCSFLSQKQTKTVPFSINSSDAVFAQKMALKIPIVTERWQRTFAPRF